MRLWGKLTSERAWRNLRHRWADSASIWCRRAGHRWCWQRVGRVCCSWKVDRRRAAWRQGCRRWQRGAGSRPPATIRARPSARREHRYVKRWSRAADPGAAWRGLPPCAPASPAPHASPHRPYTRATPTPRIPPHNIVQLNRVLAMQWCNNM